jgi:iron complex outermembrane receptor protein
MKRPLSKHSHAADNFVDKPKENTMRISRRTSLALFGCSLITLFSPVLFSQSGGITGTIVNSDDQSPLSNVHVSLIDKSIETSTNAVGKFEITDLPAGTYTLQASHVGFKTFRSSVTVAAMHVILDIQLDLKLVGMSEVVISGYRESYATGDNYSASRINAPMMSLPLSTGQITNKLLVDQNCINMNDALRNVSGVTTEFGGPHPLVVNIRGFNASIFKDGFRIGGCNNLAPGGDDLPISSIAVDRIEVLKGPSTILYGRGEPGGIVNFVSKQPQMDPVYSLEAMTGSFQQYRVGGSATGSLFNQESILYRFDGSYEKSRSYRDVVNTSAYFLKPSFAVDVSGKTKLYLTGEFAQSTFTPDHGVLMLPSMSSTGQLSGSFAPVSSRSYYFGESADNTDQKQQRAVVDVEHIVTPDWTLRAGLNYEHVQQQSTYEMDLFYSFNGFLPPGFPPGSLPSNMSLRGLNNMNSTRNDYCARLENHLRVRHSLFGADVAHGILVVADVLQIDTRYFMDYVPNQVLDPVTGNRIFMRIPVSFHEENFARSKDFGFSVQDLISIGGSWHFLLGGRYESNRVDVTQLAASSTRDTSMYNQSSGFAPRFGALYQVSDGLSLYASYMGSYQSPGADYGVWDIPADLKPERAFQTEAGVKIELLNKRALLTASVFMIKKYDVISSERNPAGVSPYTLYFNIGKEDAQGIDIDLIGEVTSNFRVSAAYNTQTMKFTNPKRLIVDGKQRYGTPAYSGNLWAVYEFSGGLLGGLGLGGGASTRSSVFVNDANEAEVPAYTTVDAIAFYQIPHLRFQLNLNNITNALGYGVSNIGGFGNPTSAFFVMPIPPFRTSFTVRFQY